MNVDFEDLNNNKNNTDNTITSAFFNKFSALVNSDKSIISLVTIQLCNRQCILALDSFGVINVWIVLNDIFYFNDLENEELINFGELKVLYPDIAFDVKNTIFTKNSSYRSGGIYFTQMDIYNGEYVVISGNFNTFMVKIEQIEKKVNNFLIVKTKSKTKIGIKNLDSDVTFNDLLLSESNLINGFEIDHENNIILTFSDSGDVFLYELINFSLIKNFNVDDYPQFKSSSNPSSISSAKIMTSDNKIVLGTNEGNLNFFDYKNFESLGFFNVSLNKYFSHISDVELESEFEISSKEAINCIEISQNYLIIGCNNFAFKFNSQINLITQVFPTLGKVNRICFNYDFSEILIAADSNRILKYKTSGKVVSDFKVSSKNVFEVNKMEISKRKVKIYIIFI